MDQALDDIIKENNRDKPFRGRGRGGNRGRGTFRGRGRGTFRGRDRENFGERRSFVYQRQPREGNNRPFNQFRSFGNRQPREYGRFDQQQRYGQVRQNKRDYGFNHGLYKVRFIG